MSDSQKDTNKETNCQVKVNGWPWASINYKDKPTDVATTQAVPETTTNGAVGEEYIVRWMSITLLLFISIFIA